MLSYSHKFMFRHYGKSGGTSIKTFFHKKREVHTKLVNYHKTIDQMKNVIIYDGYDPKDFLKFTVTRNPWDKSVSNYHHYINHYRIPISQLSFEAFICNGLIIHKKHPWVSSIVVPSFEPFDFVIKFDNLQEGFNELCSILNIDSGILPHVDYNSNRPKVNYKSYYTKKLIHIVADMNKVEIEKFGYTF